MNMGRRIVDTIYLIIIIALVFTTFSLPALLLENMEIRINDYNCLKMLDRDSITHNAIKKYMSDGKITRTELGKIYGINEKVRKQEDKKAIREMMDEYITKEAEDTNE